MNPYVSLVLDIVILCALCATIVYARRLSRQFGEMQADRKTFQKLIEALNGAATRADAATKSMREAAEGSGDDLQDQINAARTLADELQIIVEAGDHLANRLETLSGRAAAPLQSVAPPVAEERQGSAQMPRTRAEKELLEALRAKQQS